MLTHTHVYATTNIHIRTRTWHIHAHSRSYVYNVNLHIPTHVVCPSGFKTPSERHWEANVRETRIVFSVCYCSLLLRQRGSEVPRWPFWALALSRASRKLVLDLSRAFKILPGALLRPEFPVAVQCSKHHGQNCKHLGACWKYHGAAATRRTILRTKCLFNVCLCASPDTLNNPRAASAKPESFAPLATRKNNREN